MLPANANIPHVEQPSRREEVKGESENVSNTSSSVPLASRPGTGVASPVIGTPAKVSNQINMVVIPDDVEEQK